MIANYIWKNIEPYLPKIRSLSIGEKEVKPTKEDVARAFLDEINKLDKEKEQEKS